MFFSKTLKSVLRILQADDAPWQVALGAALGMVMGFSPFNGPQNYLVIVLLLFLNVNLGAATLATAAFALVAALLDPVAHWIGYALLVEAQGLTPLWTRLYNLPIVPFTRFNNTVVLGSLVLALALFVPVLFLARWAFLTYLSRWKPKLDRLGILKWMNLAKFANILDKK